jgi:hypothetical protein
MVEEKKIVPARKTSPGPAGLDGIQIEGCAFTESVGKKEPRPPLAQGVVTGNIVLMLDDAIVIIKLGSNYIRAIDRVGLWWPLSRLPKDRIPYTGPITPSMWVEIRKWWQP